jgi:3-deoxy-7-phosphoheptulonate synthase
MNTSLPSPSAFLQEIPCPSKESIISMRKSVTDALFGDDPRCLLVVGPCSVHNYEAFLDYAHRVKKLSQEVHDQFLIVLRAFVEKPRTSLGWKGFLLDPDLDGTYNIEKGIHLTRTLFSELTSLGLPIGCELLELITTPYFEDFLSWGSIGARTSSSSPHRHFASSLSFPIGFKNSVEGSLFTALNGVRVSSFSQTFVGTNLEGSLSKIQTNGNPWGHVILRGSLSAPNYSQKNIEKYQQNAKQYGSPPLIIDCSHDNSRKLAQLQIPVFKTACQHFRKNLIKGIMLESYIEEGSQLNCFPFSKEKSITDPCLNWERTKTLILEEAEKFYKTNTANI